MTPTPWRVAEMSVPNTLICSSSCREVASTHVYKGPPTEEDLANADFIVRAVNAHEESLALAHDTVDDLESIVSRLDSMKPSIGIALIATIENWKRWLAKAERGE